MTSAFSNAIASGLKSIASLAGEAVTYKRGANTVQITGAVPGDEYRGALVEAGVSVEQQKADWIFEASQLIVPTVGLTTPRQGDLIEHTAGGKVYTYEVAPPFSGDVSWRYSDRGRTRLRVHTRLTGVADA